MAEDSLPGTSLLSVLISLALFNTVFAIQNGLDLAFLWSGAPLPAGISLADHAHCGAYPLSTFRRFTVEADLPV